MKTTPNAPAFSLLYNGKDRTVNISQHLTRLAWTQMLTSESDEMEIELEDVDARWLNEFYPRKGTHLALSFGYAGAPLLPVPQCSIDEIELSGPPSVVHIRARSASSQTAVRTRSHQGFEDMTLQAIAQKIADKHGFKIVGEIEPLHLDRVTQYGQTDLAFLSALAQEHGYAVRVHAIDKRLIFMRRAKLHREAASRSYAPSDMLEWRVTDQIGDVPGSATNSYHDASSKKLVTYEYKDGETTVQSDRRSGKTSSVDQALTHKRATTPQVAASQAQAELERRQLERTVANIVIPGDPILRAGLAIELRDLGVLSGKYTCTRVIHEITRQRGYLTTLELKRVAPGGALGGKGQKVYGLKDGEVQVVGHTATGKKK